MVTSLAHNESLYTVGKPAGCVCVCVRIIVLIDRRRARGEWRQGRGFHPAAYIGGQARGGALHWPRRRVRWSYLNSARCGGARAAHTHTGPPRLCVCCETPKCTRICVCVYTTTIFNTSHNDLHILLLLLLRENDS